MPWLAEASACCVMKTRIFASSAESQHETRCQALGLCGLLMVGCIPREACHGVDCASKALAQVHAAEGRASDTDVMLQTREDDASSRSSAAGADAAATLAES